MRPLLCLLILASGLPAGGLTAMVNDVNSHGVVGDASLSLDEAIRLANGSLSVGALSSGERQRITGGGNSVDVIVVDANLLPRITLRAELTELRGQGASVQVRGLSSSQGSRPVIDAAAFSAAFKVRSPLIAISNFSIRNGKVGVDVETVTGSASVAALLGLLDLTGQTEAGFRFRAAASSRGQTTAVQVRSATLLNVPLGYDLQDAGDQGALISVSEDVYFYGVALGVSLSSDALGGTSTTEFWRSFFFNGSQFVKVRRGAASTQRQEFRFVHGVCESYADLADVQGSAGSETVFHTHHADWSAPPGRKVLHLYPRTARFDVRASEMAFVGDVFISAGRSSARISHDNNSYRNGRFVVDSDGVRPALLWNSFENCSIETASGNGAPLVISQSELHQTGVFGNSVSGPLTLDGCFRNGGNLQGSVTEINPAPTTWIARTAVGSSFVPLRTPLVLNSDLPPGIAGVWLIGLSQSRPLTTGFPFRFYFDPAAYLTLRGVSIQRSSLSLTVPNKMELTRYEFYAQMLTTPISGQTHVPPVSFPRGSIFRIIP